MKKSILLLVFFAAIATVSFGQAESTAATATVELTEGKSIDFSAVPANVQAALNKTAYKAEHVTEVFELTVDGNKQYRFIVKTLDAKRAITFDAAGTMKEDKKLDE